MKKLLIGIDADNDRSGYAVWDPSERGFVHLSDYRLYDIFVKLNELNQRFDIFVYLEDANLIKAIWHKKGGIGAARNVGKNMAIADQLRIFMEDNNINFTLLKPSGYSKYDHKSFCKITGWPEKIRTNPEKRAAGMMVYGRRK